MHLACLFVLFEVDVLLESVQFLVELAPDLDLGGQKVELFRLLKIYVLVVAVNLTHDLFDEAWVCPGDYVVKHNWKTVLIDALDGFKHVALDELGGTLKIL